MEALFMEFINSRWSVEHPPRRDPLADAAWVRRLLERWHLPVPTAISAKQIADLIELRDLLGQAVAAVDSGSELAPDTARKLGNYLDGVPLHYRLDGTGRQLVATLVPELSGWSGVLGGIVLSFARFLAEHDPRRLRQCENPDCRYVFFDESKSGSRKWCCNTCASLVRVRRFRARQRHRDEGTQTKA
ncbi:MAG: CGNR zinc finger domain-containing protein [Chloroflexota bacterium]